MAKIDTLCFIDLETTGHDPLLEFEYVNFGFMPWHEIIEMAAVLVDNDSFQIKSEFEVKIKPQHPERCLPGLVNDYQRLAQAGEWDDAIPLRAAIFKFLEFCKEHKGQKVIIGQNISFDWSFLSVAFTSCHITEDTLSKEFHYARLDVRSMAVQHFFSREYDPDDYSLRESKLSNHLGLKQETYPHRALNGARQAYFVYKELRARRFYLENF